MATFRPAACNEALIVFPNDGIESNGGEGSHVKDGADACSPAADHAMAAPSPGIAVERRDANESGEFTAVELSEFRQFRDERSRGHWANAWHGGEKLFGLAPNRRGAHAGGDVGVDLGEFLFEECDVATDASNASPAI
jgi:hypothetical protein